MAQRQKECMVLVRDEGSDPYRLEVWSDLTEEQLSSVDGVSYTFVGIRGRLIFAGVDPRYALEDVKAEIETLAEAAS